MANWYVTKGDTERGPLNDAQLRNMAVSGELHTDDLVRKDGMPQPVKAGKIRGLFPIGGQAAPEAAASKPEPPQAQAAILPTATAFNRMQGAAKAVGRQAAIKKLELHDLPNADFATGSKAYELSISSGVLSQLFDQIRTIEGEIEAKRQPSAQGQHATLGEKAKYVAAEAKKQVEAESLKQRRKKVLIEAGRAIREDSTLDADGRLAAEIAAAQAVAAKIQELKAEQAKSGGNLTSRRTLAMAAGVLAAILIVGWVVMDALTTSPEEAHQAELARIQTEKDRLAAERSAEKLKYDQETAERRAADDLRRAESDAKIERQKLEAKAAQDKLVQEREQERLEKEQKQAKEQADREAKLLAEEREKGEAAERERIKAEENRKAAQVTRHQLAESLFSKVNLDPSSNVDMSASLRKVKATLELRGPDIDQLRKLLAGKDWLGLINRLRENDYDEFPEISTIEDAGQRLRDHTFFLLVKTDEQFSDNDNAPFLCRIVLRAHDDDDYDEYLTESYPTVAEVNSDWQRHPDGVGYTSLWHPSDGRCVVAIANVRTVYEGVKRIESNLGEEFATLRQKAKLGETSEDAIKAEMRRAIDDAQAKIKAAALKL